MKREFKITVRTDASIAVFTLPSAELQHHVLTTLLELWPRLDYAVSDLPVETSNLTLLRPPTDLADHIPMHTRERLGELVWDALEAWRAWRPDPDDVMLKGILGADFDELPALAAYFYGQARQGADVAAWRALADFMDAERLVSP